MKILFVISALGKGGAERVLQVLANHFVKDHEIKILKFDSDEPFYEFSPKIEIKNLNLGVGNLGFFGNISKRFSKIFALRDELKNSDADIVISFLDNTNILTLIANFGIGKKIIITEHINYNFLQGFWRVLRRLTYPFADGLTVLTKYDYERYPYVKNRTIMPNPMFEIPEISGFKKENLILSAGRLIPHKDFKTFLKALNLVDSKLLKGWKIVIAGDGSERENLQNLANKLNLNIDFVGFVSNLHEYYAKAKIIAVTSTQEGFCNILMESIYFDIARISTDCIAGPSELIESGKDGFLCEVGDEKGVAEKLELLIKDENLRQNLVKNANLRRNDFLAENICKKWVDFINLTLEKK